MTIYLPNVIDASNFAQQRTGSTFLSGFSTLVFSLWSYNSATFVWRLFDGVGNGNSLFFDCSVASGVASVALTVASGPLVTTPGGFQNNIILDAAGTLRTSMPCAVNWLASIDLRNNLLQFYVNDQPLTFASSAGGYQTWQSHNIFLGPTDSTTTITESSVPSGASDPAHHRYSDVWLGSTPTFVDLTVVANRRKFISADHWPVSLGAQGALPFGTPPQYFQNVLDGGVASDWLTNRGTDGGVFLPGGDPYVYQRGPSTLALTGNPCPLPIPPVGPACQICVMT